MLSRKILIVVSIIIAILGIFFYLNASKTPPETKSVDQKTDAEQESPGVKIISTKPDPLEGAIVSADQTIEISFNKTLENEGEFKLRIDPELPFKIQLSSDRKTAKIIPQTPYELGKTYTLFIKSDTKFDGIGQWGEEKIFHVNTVKYRGI